MSALSNKVSRIAIAGELEKHTAYSRLTMSQKKRGCFWYVALKISPRQCEKRGCFWHVALKISPRQCEKRGCFWHVDPKIWLSRFFLGPVKMVNGSVVLLPLLGSLDCEEVCWEIFFWGGVCRTEKWAAGFDKNCSCRQKIMKYRVKMSAAAPSCNNFL